MTWLNWLMLIGILAGTSWYCYHLFGNDSQDNGVPCCGCGQCAFSGECVLVKKRRKNSASSLTNPAEKI